MAGSKEVTARAVSCRCDCLEGARDNNDWHKLREIGGEVGGQRWWMSMIDNGWWKLSLLWVIAAAAPAADDGSGGDDYDAIFTLNPWYELSNSTDQTFKFKHWDQQELQDSRPGDEVFYLMNGWFSISGGKACLKHRQKVQSDHKWLTVSTSTIRSSEGSGTTAAACLWSDSTEAVFAEIGSYPQAAPRTIPQKSEQGWARRTAHKVPARKPNTKPRTSLDLLGYQVAAEFAVHWRCLKIEARLWTEKLSLQQRPLFNYETANEHTLWIHLWFVSLFFEVWYLTALPILFVSGCQI